MIPRPTSDELRRLLRLAVPVVLAQVSIMAMGVEDAMIVGRYSATALAGVAIGSVYLFTLSSIGFGLIMGLEPLIAQGVGAQEPDTVARAFQRGLAIVAGMGTLLTLACLPARNVLLHLGQPAAIADVAGPYLVIQSPSVYFVLLFMLLRTTLQARGVTRPILLSVLLANAVNVALSIALVFGRFGLPRMGPVGSGLASAIARAVMGFGLMAFAWPELRGLFALRRDSFAAAPLARVLAIGAPVAAQLVFELGIFSVVALVMGNLGPTAAAAHQIAINIASLTYMVPLGIGTAGSVLVGQAIGAGDAAAARRSAVAALALGIGFMVCSALTFLLIPRLIARAYTNDASTIALAARLIPIAGVFQVFDGTQVVSIGILRGSGDTRTPMIVNLVGYWFVGLPLSLWLARGLGLGPQGLWWGLVAGLAAVAIIVVTRLRVRMGGPLERVHVEGHPAPGG